MKLKNTLFINKQTLVKHVCTSPAGPCYQHKLVQCIECVCYLKETATKEEAVIFGMSPWELRKYNYRRRS